MQNHKIFHAADAAQRPCLGGPSRRGLLMGAVALACAGPSVSAAEDAAILTIHGAIAGGSGGSRKFTLGDLKALRRDVLKTKTPWDGAETTYAGIDLLSLYTEVDGFGSVLRLRALNDFTGSITLAELKQYHPIAAWERDGQLMPVEDKGPLFVVFPFSAKPELWNEEIFAKCVWQLSDIEIGD